MFQFTLSIVFIIGTLMVKQQIDFMRNATLGFTKEQVVILPIRDNELRLKTELVKQEFKKNTAVLSVSASSRVPGRSMSNNIFLPEGVPENEKRTISTLTVDYDFLDVYDLEISTGRTFSLDHTTDSSSAFIVNELALKDFGWTDKKSAIGKEFNWGLGKKGNIVGVIKDFHFMSLKEKITPMVMHIYPRWFRFISIKIKTNDIASTLDFLEDSLNDVTPGHPFDYYFLDNEFDLQYKAEERMEKIFGTFSILAIIIACLGLFGLVSFTAEQRTKEIGIRKVLGSSVSGILLLLSKDFIRLITYSNIIAFPIAYYAVHTWLQNFDYRTVISIWTFIYAGIIVLTISLFTVSFHSIKASLSNPVDSLKYE